MMRTNSKFAHGAVAALVVLSLMGCAGMDENQQRMVSGGAIGVAAGAVTTVITGGCFACGIAIGGAVGTAGGYLVGKIDESTRSGSSASSSSSPTYASSNPNTNTAYSSNSSNGMPQGYPPGGYPANQ